MTNILSCFTLLMLFMMNAAEKITLHAISNVSISIQNATSIRVNGTCEQCICHLLFNKTSATAFNCFKQNETCELFFEPLDSSTIVIHNDSTSVFYFFPFLQHTTTTATVPVTTSYLTSVSGSSIVSNENTEERMYLLVLEFVLNHNVEFSLAHLDTKPITTNSKYSKSLSNSLHLQIILPLVVSMTSTHPTTCKFQNDHSTFNVSSVTFLFTSCFVYRDK